jgi:hypothetical protein
MFIIAQQALECGAPVPLLIKDKIPTAGERYKK